jgi:hypothetical protein
MRQMDFLSDGGRRKRFSASFRAVEKTRNVWFSNRDRRSGAIGRVSAGRPLLLAGARISICARLVGWSRRRPGFCSRSVVGGDGASTLVRGHPGAQSGIAVPRAPGYASRVPRVVRRFCGFFWTCRGGSARGRARRAGRRGPRAAGRCDVRATCENASASMYHELLYVWHDCCMGDSSSGLPVARAYRQ